MERRVLYNHNTFTLCSLSDDLINSTDIVIFYPKTFIRKLHFLDQLMFFFSSKQLICQKPIESFEIFRIIMQSLFIELYSIDLVFLGFIAFCE